AAGVAAKPAGSGQRRIASVRRKRGVRPRLVGAARRPEPAAVARPDRLRLQACDLRLDVPPSAQGAPRGAEGEPVRARPVALACVMLLIPVVASEAASTHIN